MENECVVAVYENADQALLAVHILNRSDFPIKQVSLVGADLKSRPRLESVLKEGDDSLHDAFVGAGLGGALGMLAAGTVVALVGGGAALIAGPLAGFATGSIVGALLGGMEGWGVHNTHVRNYESLVSQGHPLVIAHGSPRQVEEAHRLLKQTAFQELHVHARTEDESPEILDAPITKP